MGTTALGLIEVPPLLGKRALTRAFRVFRRHVPAPLRPAELDEEATAERAAETNVWLPRCRPATERWLDLDVVVDDSYFAFLHRRQFNELVMLITTAGAFRTIRTHLLDTDSPVLRLRAAAPDGRLRPMRALRQAGDPDRRVVIVLSDGIGNSWHSGAIQEELAYWAATGPVAIINPLPARQWNRTGIAARPLWLYAPSPAAPNRRYEAGALSPGEGICVPVLELDASRLAQWARFLVGESTRLSGAVTVCGARAEQAMPESPPAGRTRSPVGNYSATELVSRFRATASPAAFKLAVHLAALPLNLPVMRMIQAVTLPASRPSDLFEVLSSGLVRELMGDGLYAGPTTVTHDFAGGVREALLANGRRSETAWVIMSLIDRLGTQLGELHGIRDMLLAPATAAIPTVSTKTAPFVTPLLTAMQALGQPYHVPAVRLQENLAASASTSHTEGMRPSAQGSRLIDEETMPLPLETPDSRALAPPAQVAVSSSAKNLLPPGVSVSIRSVPLAAERDPNEPPPVWGNVPPRNIQFTGREDLLAELHERLSGGTTAVLPHALHGMGGVGKSQLAIEYVYRHTQDYDLIWWVPAEGPGQIRQSMVELAAELNLPVSREVNVAVPAVLEALRVGRPFRNWLLIFDNAENLSESREFFPTSGFGKILVTSRNPAWTGVAHTVEVNVFRREESIELLRIRDPELDDDAGDRLAEALGDLPLAIEQAAAWLAETAMSVDEYLMLLQEKTAELLRQHTPSTDYAVPVAAAWNVSLERLHENNLPALRLLQVCAFFAPEPISRRMLSGARNMQGPPELIEALADPIALNRALRAINQYALAKISHRHNTILLHRLVQRVLRSQLDDEQATVYRNCAHLLLAHADPENPGSADQWPAYAALLPHVLFSEVVKSQDKWARGLMLNTIEFLFKWGDYKASAELAQDAVDTWTQMLGESDEQKLDAATALGKALSAHGRHQEAHDLHKRTHDLLREKYGENHERTLEANGHVCSALRTLGDFRGVLELDRRQYETARQRFGPDDPFTLTHAFFYGISLRLNGMSQEAERLDRDTHARYVKVLGEDHLSTFSALAAVGLDVMENGRYFEARDLFQQLTQRIRAKYGDRHPGTIGNIGNLSVAERKAGNHDLALALSAEALSLGRARYGEGDPRTIHAALNHAINLRQAGDLPASVTLGEEVVRHSEKLYGPRHPNTPAAKINLAVSLRLIERLQDARQLNEESKNILADVLGDNHPRSIIAAINHASDLSATGSIQEARQVGEDTLGRARQFIGQDHSTTLACMLNLSLDLRALGSETEAEILFVDALTRYRRELGDTHPATVTAGQSIRANCDLYPIPT